jgi:pseudouridine-5'-phosphate glycosidase
MTRRAVTRKWLQISAEVRQAIRRGRPVVALESSLITHGLPRPVNLEVAQDLEAAVRAGRAVPATVALLDGRVHVGLGGERLARLAREDGAVKVSLRDLGPARARRQSGGTTVAATMHLARLAGLRVFATGGIGGVHRGDAGDISADLPVLARTPMVVVCAGAKSLLDLPRTLEWLETHGVPVLGWNTDEFPAFFARSSGLRVPFRVDTSREAAAIALAHWSGGAESAVLLCAACPGASAVALQEAEAWRAKAEADARRAGVEGARLTPFVLSRMADHSRGRTLAANRALLHNNAQVAAQVASALGPE